MNIFVFVLEFLFCFYFWNRGCNYFFLICICLHLVIFFLSHFVFCQYENCALHRFFVFLYSNFGICFHFCDLFMIFNHACYFFSLFLLYKLLYIDLNSDHISNSVKSCMNYIYVVHFTLCLLLKSVTIHA